MHSNTCDNNIQNVPINKFDVPCIIKKMILENDTFSEIKGKILVFERNVKRT